MRSSPGNLNSALPFFTTVNFMTNFVNPLTKIVMESLFFSDIFLELWVGNNYLYKIQHLINVLVKKQSMAYTLHDISSNEKMGPITKTELKRGWE